MTNMKNNKTPINWNEVRIGDICFTNRNTLSERTSNDCRFKYIDLSSVKAGNIIFPSTYMIFEEAPSRARRLIQRNDIIMSTVRPNLQGFAHIDFDAQEYICSTGFAVLTVKPNTSSKFIYYCLYSKSVETQINNMLVGSNYPAINSSDVASLKIFLPPLSEQEKIAGILSCWDNGIEKLSALIEKKKIQKKALMQQLLNGKHRLKGFTTPWQEVKLGDIGDLYQPQTISQSDLELDGYPVYGANGLIGYYHKFNHETWQIMITCRGSTCGTVNRTSGKSWITGNAMVVNVDNYKNNKLFLFFKLLNENFLSIVSGSGQPQIVRTPLAKWKLYIPFDLAEQKAIAEILSKADEEIELLNKKLEAFKQEKKALMQQLLTGKIRVKVN